MELKRFRADLHVHTCLSPCADLQMVPSAIIAAAKQRGLDIIAICDHNSAENVPAVRKVGESAGVFVLGGMEICSAEEAHVLALFDDDEALFEMQNIVYDHLFGSNDEKYFGEQVIVDENDRPTALSELLLIGTTTLGVDEIVGRVGELGGLTIASHIDREAFSLIGQLGFIPEGLGLDAVEISARCDEKRADEYRSLGFEFVRSSDAHYLSDVGKISTVFELAGCSVSELSMAFRAIDGRTVGI